MRETGLVRPDTVYTVSQLTEVVRLTLEAAFPRVYVEGEVSNFKRHTSGHVYFTLKDERAALRAVMWRSEARAVVFDLKDGLQVICRGRLSVYDARGDYQLYVDHCEPKGKGALQLAYEQLREKLRAEGLFDERRKRPLPLRPRTIGIVTSPTGAALRDILRVLARRFAKVRILIYPAKVQGEGAAEEIVAGLDVLGRRGDIDVIIAGRGGGSIEDLWAFNEEKVARAIVACPVPVISAVGHEVDFTIADFVADVRASTPSAAAEMVVKTESEFRERIEGLVQRLGQLTRLGLGDRRAEVADLSRHRIFENFRLRLRTLGQRVDELEMRAWKVLRGEKQTLSEKKAVVSLWLEKVRSAARARIREDVARWKELTAALNSLSPMAVVKKGYAVVWKDGGLTLVRRVQDVAAGEAVIVSFYRGEFEAEVRHVDLRKALASRFLKEEE